MPIRKRRAKSGDADASAEIPDTVAKLLSGIQSDDADVRTAAWRGAGEIGAAAIGPLADLTRDESREVARAAMRGLWQIVRCCGRPGADAERNEVSAALVGLLSGKRAVQFRRDVLWMLSEIADDGCVSPMAALLSDAELREDACLALERVPGSASLDALKAALEIAPDEFKPNIAESLRRRGEDAPDIPSGRMTPMKPTEVTPL